MVTLRWLEDEAFRAELDGDSGLSVTLDGSAKSGFSPMQSLLASLAGCMAIDVVLILKKMRTSFDGLDVRIEGERREDPPRAFRSIKMRFVVSGGVPRDKAERAVKLSLDRYCSVFHTLRKDIAVETEVQV